MKFDLTKFFYLTKFKEINISLNLASGLDCSLVMQENQLNFDVLLSKL